MSRNSNAAFNDLHKALKEFPEPDQAAIRAAGEILLFGSRIGSTQAQLFDALREVIETSKRNGRKPT